MKRWLACITAIILLTGCGAKTQPEQTQSTAEVISEVSSVVSEISPSEAEQLAASQAAEKAASEAALAAEKAASEAEALAAASQAAEQAALKAASEAAAQAAADEAAKAASEAAAKAAADAAAKAASEAAAKAAADTAAANPAIPVVTGANFLSSVEKKIITMLNEERAAKGLGELTYDQNLQSAARIRSRELYKSDTFAHTRPNGTSWVTVLREDIPIQFVSAGENLCMTEYNDPSVHNATSASFWVDQWINSPPHYENIIKSEYTHVGVGVYSIEKDGMTYAYATTIFAHF